MKLALFLPEKSVFLPKKSKKSDFHYFGLPHKAENCLKISLNMEYVQMNVDFPNIRIKLIKSLILMSK